MLRAHLSNVRLTPRPWNNPHLKLVWRVFPKAVAVRRVLSRTRPRRGVADLAPASGTDVVLPAQDELQRLMKAHGEKFSDEEVKEMTVYDHLIPFDGPHGFSFVPDGSYDGYKLENGFWVLQPKLYRQTQETPFTPEPILGNGRKSKKDLFGRSKKN